MFQLFSTEKHERNSNPAPLPRQAVPGDHRRHDVPAVRVPGSALCEGDPALLDPAPAAPRPPPHGVRPPGAGRPGAAHREPLTGRGGPPGAQALGRDHCRGPHIGNSILLVTSPVLP